MLLCKIFNRQAGRCLSNPLSPAAVVDVSLGQGQSRWWLLRELTLPSAQGLEQTKEQWLRGPGAAPKATHPDPAGRGSQTRPPPGFPLEEA